MSRKSMIWIIVGALLIVFFIIGKMNPKSEPVPGVKQETEQTQAQKDSLAIEKHFTPTGQNLEFSVQVRNRLNDPESFEHVSSKHWKVGDSTTVIAMTYRCKNANNATVTKNAQAEMSNDGTITKVFGLDN